MGKCPGTEKGLLDCPLMLATKFLGIASLVGICILMD